MNTRRMEERPLQKDALCIRGDGEAAVTEIRKDGDRWTKFCAAHRQRSIERFEQGK